MLLRKKTVLVEKKISMKVNPLVGKEENLKEVRENTETSSTSLCVGN